MHFEWKEVLFLAVFVVILFSFMIPGLFKANKGSSAKKDKKDK